jgi:EmrB/QacA subfamily drug resistance transporter
MTATLERARPDVGPAPLLTPRQRTRVLAAMCLALVLVIAGVSMLAVAVPDIAAGLHLSQTSQTWVADAYALVLASLLLVAGAIGDRYGRRGALLGGLVLFGGGAALSALASSGGALIAARAVTGIGGALIMPGTLSTITSVFPPDERARAVGIWAGFAGAGGTLGMLAAGWMLDVFSWQSIFVVTAVGAVLTFVAVSVFVPATKAEHHVGLDPVGAVLSAAAIGSLVLGIIEAPNRGWGDALTITSVAVGLLLAGVFVAWELRTDHPLLDPRLFAHRGFATGSASMLVLFLAMFGAFLVVLQYLQLVDGYGTLKAAAALLPLTFVMMPISMLAAPLSERFGQRLVGGSGLALTALGTVGFATLHASSGFAPFLVSQVVLGAGFGLAMTPATNAIVSSLPASKQGVASAVNDTTREIGTALGIAIMGSTFDSGYRSAIHGHLGGLSASAASQAKEAPGLALQVASDLGARGNALVHAAQDAFMSGMRVAMLLGAVLLAGAALYTLVLGPGRQEEREEDLLDLDLELELQR